MKWSCDLLLPFDTPLNKFVSLISTRCLELPIKRRQNPIGFSSELLVFWHYCSFFLFIFSKFIAFKKFIVFFLFIGICVSVGNTCKGQKRALNSPVAGITCGSEQPGTGAQV